MKKNMYMTPEVQVIETEIFQFLMSSGVNSDLGIEFGGVDEDGMLDPAAPELSDGDDLL